jgi:hypothetical protein
VKLLALALSAIVLATPGAAKLQLVGNAPQGGTINTDLAFWGHLAFQGNYDGVRIVDISNPSAPVEVGDLRCHGPQNDISVWGHLVFLSVDHPQTSSGCDSENAVVPRDPSTFEGIRIVDASDPAAPRLIATVPTDCGSHTHTLVPDIARNRVLLYVSSYPLLPGPHCGHGAEADPQHRKISIVAVPLDAPETARLVATPRIDAPAWLPDPKVSAGVGCHDITVFLPLHLAAASCMSEGQLWDIRNPLVPRVLSHIRNKAIFFWHSAAFTWDGKYVAFGDESFPGSCNNPKRDRSGRIWIYRVADSRTPVASFTIPRPQAGEICSAHMFDFVPVKGRYLLVSSWYEGGADVIDMTSPSRPRELASFDPEGNDWAAYWYDGHVYSSDWNRGLDVLGISGIDVSRARKVGHLNPQTQEGLIR